MRRVLGLAVVLSVAGMVGCGGGGGSPPTPTPAAPPPAVTVTPAVANLRLFDRQQFSATVSGTSSTAVLWAVNGVTGGAAATGTISTTGLYTAPNAPPSNSTITITATSQADPTKSGSIQFPMLNPVPAVASVTPGSIDPGAFVVAITGSKSISGATVALDGVNLTTTFVSATQLRASGTAAQAAGATANLRVTNPQTAGDTTSLVSNTQAVPVNLINSRVAARFLDQATFGATPADIAHVAQIGLQAYVAEQFAATPSTIPDAINTTTLSCTAPNVETEWLNNALTGKDQLRQRTAFALEQIWVISGVTITQATEYVPFLQIIQQDAFGNFATLMKDVTLNPAMGDYLNMVNSDKAPAGQHANENYARELMQLFTIGLTRLNPDGTPILDAGGNPVPTYDQPTIQEFSRALTGWTWPTKAGAVTPTSGHNPLNYVGNMVAIEVNHDAGAKTLLNGTVLPAGQSAALDLEGALANIFNHPNVGPFICSNLIQHFVTSNPSPAYVQRCAAAFNDNGSGVRGDLKAVLSGILMDTEARRADYPNAAGANDGHLREPILFATSLLRNLNATTDGVSADATVVNSANGMGQRLLYSPTVFNYYPPDWVAIAPSAAHPAAIYGPEFALQTTATATVRANFVQTLVGAYNATATVTPFTGATIDYTPYATLANDSNLLLDALDVVMMHGQMSSAMRASVKTAVDTVAAGNTVQRAKTAVYLIGSSSQYQVAH